MTDKANGYELNGDAANLLFFPSGIFALSNGDGVDAVTLDAEFALLQTGHTYIDAFPAGGGARAVALKAVGKMDDERGFINVWTSDF